MRRAASLALLLAVDAAAAFGRPSRGLRGKHGASTDTTLTLYPILDPDALCNDGSRSGYYYAPATDPRKARATSRGGSGTVSSGLSPPFSAHKSC